MKTTLEIGDRLWRKAKRAAIGRGCTLREMVDRGLRRELSAGGAATGEIAWVAASGHLPAGLDLSSRDTMLQWIEGAADEAARARPARGHVRH
jgi:hypothetical protein